MNCILSPSTSELSGAADRAQGIRANISMMTHGDASSSLMVETMPYACPASPICNTDNLSEMTQVVQESYTTIPMPAFKPYRSSYVLDEEELYSSFEQAISERLQSQHLIRTGTQKLPHEHNPKRTSNRARTSKTMSGKHYGSSARGSQVSLAHNVVAPQRTWQTTLLLVVFGLMCLLAGFDLMGLLIVLHMH